MPSPATKTNTLQPMNVADARSAFHLALKSLLQAFQNCRPGGPAAMQADLNHFKDEMIRHNATEDAVIGWWDELQPREAKEEAGKRTLGWLICYSKFFERPGFVAEKKMGLPLASDPWGKIRESIQQGYPEGQEKPSTPPAPEPEPAPGLPHPNELPPVLGQIEGQPIVIWEELADAIYVIMWLLYGALHHWQIDRGGRGQVEFSLADIVGDSYWGFEAHPHLIWYAGQLPPLLPPEGEEVNPFYDSEMKAYQAELDWRATLPVNYRRLLPVMQCVWLAHDLLDRRVEARQDREGGKVDFHPYYLILRRWNLMLRLWKSAGRSTKDLQAAWRRVYGHPGHHYADLPEMADYLINAGDAVRMTPVLTTTELGSVDMIGMSESKLNSSAIIIPGDGSARSGRGFKTLREALKDPRFKSWDGKSKGRAKELLEEAERFSARTGHQVALVALDTVELYTVMTCTDDDRNLKGIRSNRLISNYKFLAAS